MNFNTKGRYEFIFDHIIGFIPMWVIYKAALFRQIGFCSYEASSWILIAMALTGAAIGIVMDFRKERNGESVFMNIMLGFGVYTVLTYWQFVRGLILFILLISLAVALTLFLRAIRRKVKKRWKYRKIMIRRFGKAGRQTKFVLSMGMFMLMSAIIWKMNLGEGLVASSVKTPDSPDSLKMQTIDENMDTLLLLQEDTWKTLSPEEKLGVLRTVADIERSYLGIPHGLSVVAGTTDKGVLAHYTEVDHRITVSVDSLKNDTALSLLNSVAHEAYHCLQHRIIDAYEEVSPELRNLQLFNSAAVYKKEFDNYTSPEDDVETYYQQTVEKDARDYAAKASTEYLVKIYKYLSEMEAEADPEHSDDRQSEYRYLDHNVWTADKISRYVDDNGMMGYVDEDGKEITPAKFLYASVMYDGIALVCETEGSVYYIDDKGKRVTCDYPDGYSFGPDLYTEVRLEDGKWAIINRQGDLLFSGADKITDNDTNYIYAVADGQVVVLRIVEGQDKVECIIVKELPEYADVVKCYLDRYVIVADASGKQGLVYANGEPLYPAEYETIRFDTIYMEKGGTVIIIRLRKEDGSCEIVYMDEEREEGH